MLPYRCLLPGHHGTHRCLLNKLIASVRFCHYELSKQRNKTRSVGDASLKHERSRPLVQANAVIFAVLMHLSVSFPDQASADMNSPQLHETRACADSRTSFFIADRRTLAIHGMALPFLWLSRHNAHTRSNFFLTRLP